MDEAVAAGGGERNCAALPEVAIRGMRDET